MNFSFLASLILFILILTALISRKKKQEKKAENSFWARERQANSVRRKSLEGLPYITIPLETLPTQLLQEDPQVLECLEILQTLSGQSIVNFTGWSNTDLKLAYGTANITALSEYDQNYTVMVRTLQKWADILWDAGFREQAASVMQFAVSTRTDVSKSYYLLAQYYASRGETEKIQSLTETAETLRSANRKAIVRTLREAYP